MWYIYLVYELCALLFHVCVTNNIYECSLESQKQYGSEATLQGQHRFVCCMTNHINLFDFPILATTHEQLVYIVFIAKVSNNSCVKLNGM